jgi:PAS domain S-box-containing protein
VLALVPYEQLFSAIPDGIALVGRDLVYRLANAAYAERLGRAREGIEGRPVAEVIGEPAFSERLLPALRGALAGERVAYRAWFDAPVQGRRYEDVVVSPCRDASGAVDGVVINVRDVTAERRAEIARRRVEDQLQTMLDQTPGLVSITGLDGRYQLVNRRARERLGLARADVIGRLPAEVLDPAVGALIAAADREVLTTLEPHTREATLPTPAGPLVVMSTRFPLFDEAGQPCGVCAICIDISGQRQVEQELAVALAKYRTLFDCFPMGLTLADHAGQILEVNQMAERLLGISREEHQARDIDSPEWSCLRPDGSPLPLEDLPSVEALQTQTPVVDREIGVRRPDGTVVWLSVTAAPVPVDGCGVLMAYVDIGERRQADAYRARAVRLRAARDEARARAGQLARLASQLSLTEWRERQRLAALMHDHLQQLLVAAHFNLGGLMKRVPEPDRAVVARVSQLVDDAIGATRKLTAKLSPPVLKEGTLAEALEWLARWMEEYHGMRVDLRLKADLDPGREDVRLLVFESVREALLNVVKHAGVREATVVLDTAGPGRLQVRVIDSGQGFDAAALDVSDRLDSGFGLVAMRERLALLGGSVTHESSPGAGTRVVLLAPLGEILPPTESQDGEPDSEVLGI